MHNGNFRIREPEWNGFCVALMELNEQKIKEGIGVQVTRYDGSVNVNGHDVLIDYYVPKALLKSSIGANPDKPQDRIVVCFTASSMPQKEAGFLGGGLPLRRHNNLWEYGVNTDAQLGSYWLYENSSRKDRFNFYLPKRVVEDYLPPKRLQISVTDYDSSV